MTWALAGKALVADVLVGEYLYGKMGDSILFAHG